MAISRLSVSVFWTLVTVNGVFAVNGRAIVSCGGRDARFCRADDESLQPSDPFGAYRYGFSPHRGVGSDHHQCSNYGFDAASDLWSRLWQHPPFCENFRVCPLQALRCDAELEGLCSTFTE